MQKKLLKRNKKKNGNIWKFLIGVFLVFIGILGVILPILPGIPFLVVGAFLLGFVSEQKVVDILKKTKTKSYKKNFYNKLINFGIVKYIYKRNIRF